jgi:hypothetical protein
VLRGMLSNLRQKSWRREIEARGLRSKQHPCVSASSLRLLCSSIKHYIGTSQTLLLYNHSSRNSILPSRLSLFFFFGFFFATRDMELLYLFHTFALTYLKLVSLCKSGREYKKGEKNYFL